MSETPNFGESDGIVTDTEVSSDPTDPSGPSIPEIPEDVAQMIVDAVESEGGLIEIPAFAADAPDFPEEYSEYYGDIEAETLSIEDIFGYDWSGYDYIGTPPVVASEKLTEEQKEQLTDEQLLKSDGDEKKYVIKPEFAEQLQDASVLKGGTTPISKAINGRFAEMVTDTFGDDCKVSVGKGKKRNHNNNPVEAQKYVAFWVSDSDTAPLKREKARMEAGEIEESAFEEWKESNGFEDEE